MRLLVRHVAIAMLAAPALLAQGKGARPVPTPAPAPKAGTALPPPAHVSAVLTASNRISVTWSAVPGAESYVVGRGTPKGGVRRLQLADPRATSHEDFDIVGGETYTYQIAAVQRGLAGARALSDPVEVPMPASADKGPTAPLGGGVPGAVAGKRYRISVIGLWAARQTYDNPLQVDGKGDEVYLAAHVAHIDTSRADVVEHAVLRTAVIGDVNGYRDRLRGGSANGMGESGGIITGDRLPASGSGPADPKGASRGFPFVVFEGELVPGQSAVAITPTIWEWDGQAELFERWVVTRQLRVAELVKPEVLALALSSRAYAPIELASPALAIQTNRFGDARDRPIGMEFGVPANEEAAELVAAGDTTRATPASAPPRTCGPGGGGIGMTRMLRNLACVISKVAGIAEQVVGPIVAQAGQIANFALGAADPSWEGAKSRLGGDGRNAVRLEPPDKAFVTARLDSLRAAPSLQRSGVGVLLPRLLAQARRVAGARDAFFFEKTVILTPAAIDLLHQSSPGTMSRPAGVIDIHYADTEMLKGRYTLLLRVEKLR